MSTKQLIQSVCLASCLAGLLVPSPAHAADSEKDEQAIETLVMAVNNAMNAKDAAALSMVFNEDGEFTNVVGMRADGRKAIEEFHQPLFESDGTRGITLI